MQFPIGDTRFTLRVTGFRTVHNGVCLEMAHDVSGFATDWVQTAREDGAMQHYCGMRQYADVGVLYGVDGQLLCGPAKNTPFFPLVGLPPGAYRDQPQEFQPVREHTHIDFVTSLVAVQQTEILLLVSVGWGFELKGGVVTPHSPHIASGGEVASHLMTLRSTFGQYAYSSGMLR